MVLNRQQQEAENRADLAQRRVMIEYLMRLWNCTEAEMWARIKANTDPVTVRELTESKAMAASA